MPKDCEEMIVGWVAAECLARHPLVFRNHHLPFHTCSIFFLYFIFLFTLHTHNRGNITHSVDELCSWPRSRSIREQSFQMLEF